MNTTITLKTPLKTPTGNIIAVAGTYELLELGPHPDGKSQSATILSSTHYTGRTIRVGFRVRKADRINY